MRRKCGKAMGFLIAIWLAVIFACVMEVKNCYASVPIGDSMASSSSELYEQQPNIGAGDNATAALGYEWASFGLQLIKTIGMIVTVWGMLEFGTSVYHHDPSMRAQGLLYVITGIILTNLGVILREWGIFR